MDVTFFDEATREDTDSSFIFFVSLRINRYEPDQTYTTIDKDGNEVEKTIRAYHRVANFCNDNVIVFAAEIRDPKGPVVKHYPYPCSIQLPPSGTDRIEAINLTIDNIDRTYVDILRRLRFPLLVDIGVGFVNMAPIDVIDGTPIKVRRRGMCKVMEFRFVDLQLMDVTITPELITGRLIVDNLLWRKYPNNNETYSNKNFPGLWPLDSGQELVPPVLPPSGEYDHDVNMALGTQDFDGTVQPRQTLVFRFKMPASGNSSISFTAVAMGAQVSWDFKLKGYPFATSGVEPNAVFYTSKLFSSSWVIPKGEWLYFLATNATSGIGNFRFTVKVGSY